MLSTEFMQAIMDGEGSFDVPEMKQGLFAGLLAGQRRVDRGGRPNAWSE
jgi:hypothetical protein